MRDALIAATLAVLGSITLLNIILSLATARRLRLLSETHPSERRSLGAFLPPVGSRVDSFSVTTLAEESLSLDDLFFQDNVIVFATMHCEACAAMRSALLAEPLEVPVSLFIDGPGREEEARAYAESFGSAIQRAVWIDGDVLIARAFSVGGYPTIIRVVNGVIAAASATFDHIRDVYAAEATASA
jgi:hypothetical protein